MVLEEADMFEVEDGFEVFCEDGVLVVRITLLFMLKRELNAVLCDEDGGIFTGLLKERMEALADASLLEIERRLAGWRITSFRWRIHRKYAFLEVGMVANAGSVSEAWRVLSKEVPEIRMKVAEQAK